MSEGDAEYLCIADTDGLHGIAAASGNLKRAYYVGAARIADKLNSGFPRGAYDDSVELFTASIAFAKKCRIVTSPAQIAVYTAMACQASDLDTWVVEHALS